MHFEDIRDYLHRIFEEELYEQYPPAREQEAHLFVASTAARRADVFDREPRIEDIGFSLWAWCLPGCPQDSSYTAFMQEVHRELFEDADAEVIVERAQAFFTPEFLRLSLHELGSIVNTPGILEEEGPDVERIEMFSAAMLPEEILPHLGGVIYFERRAQNERGQMPA